MSDPSIEIITSPTTSLVAENVISDVSGLNLISQGERARIEVVETGERFTVPSGETVVIEAGETREHSIVEVPSGSTLTVDGTLNCEDLRVQGTLNGSGSVNISEAFIIEYEELEPFSEFASQYVRHETLDASQRIRPTIPDTASIDSPLVGVRALNDLADRDVRGFWAAIDRVVDTRNRALTDGPRVRFEVTKLAPFDEYSDYQSARDGLEIQ